MDKFIKNSMSIFAEKFKIRNNSELFKTHYKTGFAELDKLLGGGFTAGLHVLGAISSLGKSTFALQLLHNIAENDMPVLLFSLEMKSVDLVAKSVSRQIFIDSKFDEKVTKTSSQLTSKEECELFNENDWQRVEKSAQTISDTSKNIYVYECSSQKWDVDLIIEVICEYIKNYGQVPFVVIDYLQIVQVVQDRYYTDKQVVDLILHKLKQLSDNKNIPILLISSFNRESYDSETTLKSFKESGNIEYTADTILALQLAGIGDDGFNVDNAKMQFPRKVELKILKQRYGMSGCKIEYDFYSKFNYFKENKSNGWKIVNDKNHPFVQNDEKGIENKPKQFRIF